MGRRERKSWRGKEGRNRKEEAEEACEGSPEEGGCVLDKRMRGLENQLNGIEIRKN